MTHKTYVTMQNLQDVLDGIEQKIAGLGSTLTGIYTWQANNQYKAGDVCILNGSLFICLATHTSSSAFSTDIANWNLVYSDIDEWASNTYYVVGASVIANNAMYKCKTTHTSGSTFNSTEEANWDVVVGTSGNVKIKNWATSTQYKQYDVVMVNNNLYRCVSNHTSTTFSSDISNWELIYASIGNWQASTYYPVGVFAVNDKKLYKCKTQHTSGSTFSDTNWDLIAGGGGIETWVASKAYAVGSLVLYNNKIYKCITANNDSTFTPTKWTLINALMSDWATTTIYSVGDIVLYGGSIYKCKTAHTASANFSTDISNWALVYASISNWSASTYYPVGSCVIANGILYQCKVAHTSASAFTTDNWDNVGGKEYVQPYEDTPIGTIISYMGTTAPEDYLICDGTVYNIADYNDLADFINTQFGSYNKFGGDGTTTFAVPDLRGEFLRGSGTNSHTSMGNGAAVGVHQDGTGHMASMVYSDNNMYVKKFSNDNSGITSYSNVDTFIQTSITNPRSIAYTPSNVYNDSSKQSVYYTARPTNTSILYCIKYTNAPSMQPSNIYSTTEKRIGTWIDGKPLYQMTFEVTTPSSFTNPVELATLPTGVNVSNVKEMVASAYNQISDSLFMPNYFIDNTVNYIAIWIRANRKITVLGGSNLTNTKLAITIKYTKT